MVENAPNPDNAKVNLILDAAQKRFAHYGLIKTTMTEIASDVGLSKASLYYYFADKDSLFRAVVKREQDGFIEEMRKMLLDKDSAHNKFLLYIASRHEYFRKVFMNLSQLKMSIENVKPLLGNLMDTFMQSEIDIISKIFKEGIKNAEFNKINVAEYADLFIASMQGLRTITIKNRDSYLLEKSDFTEIENRINKLAEIFITGIKKNK